MKAYNIKWDTDGDEEVLSELPSEIEIPEGMIDGEEISDYISDETGFCHGGFLLSANVYLVNACTYDNNHVPNVVGSFYVVSENKPTEIELKSMPEWDDIKKKFNCEGISSIELDNEPEEGLTVINYELGSFASEDIKIEKCGIELVVMHESNLDVYCDADMWKDDEENLYAVKIRERVVGFIVYKKEEFLENALYVSQMEILEGLKGLGVGRATIESITKSQPDIKTITGLASFAAVPFWDRIGASFASGGEFTVEDAWKYANEDDEDLYDEYWESTLAFTLDVETV